MSWSQTPNGIATVLGGRRCEVVRRNAPRGSSSAFRACVEGIEERKLRNNGYARDFSEGKDICFEALTAAGLLQSRTSLPASSKYPPHPIEVRARALDAAVALLRKSGTAPPADGHSDALGALVREACGVALYFENFLLGAGKQISDLGTDTAAPSGSK